MLNQPVLTICVPSRNRQIYFQETIRALTSSLRTDVQFVFADNSDDPTIMNEFMKDVQQDPRVTYIPSTDRVLSMVDNWERTAEAARGEYWVFIGDDDYVDPDLVDYIKNLTRITGPMDGIAWRLIGYTWPYEGRPRLTAVVPFASLTVKVEQADLFRKMFGWQDCTHVPRSGFSIYHSAISGKLMHRIRQTYGGRFFEHPVVDFDSAFKVICLGQKFSATARPFGIMGSCPLSNSFGVGKLQQWRERIADFVKEAGYNYETDEQFRKFPFTSALGTTATIAVAQQWFKKKYDIEFENWGENFAKGCAFDCCNYRDRESFEAAADSYRTAFKLWQNGKYLRFFNPSYNTAHENNGTAVSSGFSDEEIYLDQEIGGCKTPGELFAIVRGMVTPVDQMEIDASGLKYSWEVEDKVKKMLYA